MPSVKDSDFWKGPCPRVTTGSVTARRLRKFSPTLRHGPPGLYLKKDGKILVMLPGPAREMHPMFEKFVVPKLQAEGILSEVDCYLQLRTAGIGESALADKVEPILANKKGLVVGYCAHAGMVDLRLSSLDADILPEETLHQLGDECRKELGEDLPVLENGLLAEVIFRELNSLNQTLAVAESCTGGLLSSHFTEIPGISKVFQGGAVCYNDDAKVQMLYVPRACSNSTVQSVRKWRSPWPREPAKSTELIMD